ncbi:hypothetical protein ASJ79_01950 [Mycobacterium sp. NAZ190054]|nr:hypothetical protein ASJ79_01950 [Mycobacterium sp. NAZ190054]
MQKIRGRDLKNGFLGLFNAFVGPVIPIVTTALRPIQTVITNTFQDMLNVAQQVANVVAAVALVVTSPVAITLQALGAVADDFLDAVKTGDLAGAACAVLGAPAVVIDVFVNGYGTNGGLLSETRGLFSTLLNVRDAIANVLRPVPVPTPR